jgi:hypothetical protein
MITGGISRAGSGRGGKVRAEGLRFDQSRLVLVLSDHREVSLPLDFYPTLKHASEAERADWVMIGPGKGFHWPKLDLDLSVEGLIDGLREAIPRPPSRRVLQRGKSRAKG